MRKLTRKEFIKGTLLSTFALSNLDFIFKKKKDQIIPSGAKERKIDKWVYSTCGYCSVGCGMKIGVTNGKAIKVKGNEQHPTNKGRLCIKGYTEYLLFDTPGRAAWPLIKKEGKFHALEWNKALEIMSAKFKETIAKYGPNAIAVYSTGQLQNEEFYCLGKLVRAGIKTDHYDGNTTLCMSSAVSGYKRSLGEDTPCGCYEDLEEAECIMLIGSNISEMHPILYDRILDGSAKKKTTLITVDPRQTLIASRSDIYLDIKPGKDLLLINAMAAILFEEGLVDEEQVRSYATGIDELKAYLKGYTRQYIEEATGIAWQRIREAVLLYKKAKSSLILWTMGVNQSALGTKTVEAICNLALITGHIGRVGAAPFSLTGQCNAMGSRALSATTTYPGFRKLDQQEERNEIASLWNCSVEDLPKKRTPAKEIFEKIRKGEIRILWIIGTNPAGSFPDTNKTKMALKNLEFLVVQDSYHPTETSLFADLILPAAMWGEKTGTMINSERRVNLARKAVNPPAEAKSDFEIFLMVAESMGYGGLFKGWENQEDAFREIRLVTKGRICDLYGMNYARLENEKGIQWPCPELEHSGTKRLFEDLHFYTTTGKANLHIAEYEELTEATDKDFPFILNTGRNQYHWHTGTKTRKIEVLNELSPAPYIEINPIDAKAYGIVNNEWVEIESKQGVLSMKVSISAEIRPGTVFIPFHYGEKTPNYLIPDITDEFSYQPNFKQSAVRLKKRS